MIIDGVRLRKQSVTRDQCRHGWKQREEAVEYDARRYCQKPVFGRLAHSSPKDILPALPWDLGRGDGAAPSARFRRPLKLRLHSLLATLRFTEWLVLLLGLSRVANQKGESSGGID
jgi:hypothetical protein